MNKNAIKKFATEARRELLSRVAQRALKYGITDISVGNPDDDSVNGHLLSSTEKKQRVALIAQVTEKGYTQVMEEVAYTWFNRFSALRFMEVNGYLPTRVRVFTDENNVFHPQILTEALHLELDGLDRAKVYAYKEANDTENLYKYLLITQCNALNSVLPGMFQKIEDYTELLFPDNLLREGSVVQQMITQIPEEDWKDAVQIIGWLYQYYNSEKKEAAISLNKIIKKEDIPAATQLFTTDWVVRYIIDNSVGRYWIERNENSNLNESLDFFVKPSDGIKHIEETIKPQDVTVLDPCVGSGHFASYAFDVLMKIYNEYGYSEREAVVEIIKNNIYGIDIDARATQLAYFSIMMKARQYDASFFRRGIQPNIYEVKESNNIDKSTVQYFCNEDTTLVKDLNLLLKTMNDAKEFGSILKIPDIHFDNLYKRLHEIENDLTIYQRYILDILKPIIDVAYVMSQKFAIVATNPPYMNKFDNVLKDFINNNYKDYSGDMFSVFMYRNFHFCKKDGYTGFMTPFVWMFIKTYEKLRRFILSQKTIISLVQMEYSAFEEATVPICSFVLKNGISAEKGQFFRLSAFKGGMEIQKEKVLEAVSNPDCGYRYSKKQEAYLLIPGCPIAYWIDKRILDCFENGSRIDTFAYPKQGLATADNNRFLRLWFEVDIHKAGLSLPSREKALKSGLKWFPYNKGGGLKKWYGNNEYLVNWEHDGFEICNFRDDKGKQKSRPQNIEYFFKQGLSWCKIASSKFSMRFIPQGFLFDVAGCTLFVNEKYIYYILGYMNSKVNDYILEIISPTLNYEVGHVASLPIIFSEDKNLEVEELVKENIYLCKDDWDSYENSWDFKRNPLLKSGRLSEIYDEYKIKKENDFTRLKLNEEKINKIFSKIYDVATIISSEVDDDEIILGKSEYSQDMKALIAYAVGCMFGRYSLDIDGLVYAGGEWDDSKYHSFPADKDNIIPICDDEYFEDDIVGHFVKFVEVVYGKDTLQENLQFIADALGGKGQPKEVIRNYFLNGFYADHCKIYRKRPIYWMFDSGKKNGFKCLMYMHRYQPDTIARIRTDYVHEQQARYRTAIIDLETRLDHVSTSERVKLNKQLKKLNDKATEILAYEEKIHHLADQMISIDLDDGVKKNYEIFKDVLAKIK